MTTARSRLAWDDAAPTRPTRRVRREALWVAVWLAVVAAPLASVGYFGYRMHERHQDRDVLRQHAVASLPAGVRVVASRADGQLNPTSRQGQRGHATGVSSLTQEQLLLSEPRPASRWVESDRTERVRVFVDADGAVLTWHVSGCSDTVPDCPPGASVLRAQVEESG